MTFGTKAYPVHEKQPYQFIPLQCCYIIIYINHVVFDRNNLFIFYLQVNSDKCMQSFIDLVAGIGQCFTIKIGCGTRCRWRCISNSCSVGALQFYPLMSYAEASRSNLQHF